MLALSGGVDSVVLLDILAGLREQLQFHLSATHVNHQLSPHASDWADFCVACCQDYGVQLEIASVTITPAGDSLEAAARDARHAALARSTADFIVLAHHLDDQVETLLLQMLRGSGVAGASAMAEENRRLLRPLLELPRTALEHYARRHDLAWVEDESNLDTRFDRNFLRHRLLPIVEERFPAYRETLYRASRNFAESAHLQDELARLDGAKAIDAPKLSVTALAHLPPSRARNLLRYYLKQHGIAAPSAIRLEETLHQLLNAKRDAQIKIPFGAFELRRSQDRAWVTPVFPPPPLSLCYPWQGENEVQLPELGGLLTFWPTHGQGISLTRLQQERVTIRVRQGGERLRPDSTRPSRSLKNLFQETGMPPWSRQALPLLYSGENLAAVVGIGIDCRFQAQPGEPGVMLEWNTTGNLDYNRTSR
ncbi:tRNA(Ile)-lysidine synthase [Sulfurimicrobium lacus]|uniref:tRNA(Ile)-lysidine synthase n=1 Tax=Sulfurimicrobium lacus TaxID=2715678 RepID=A0A6F8VHW9_9PROT|nr:tRNA lysidine(34) synthetase TilS [Sulfurimicrobium lacus]BCB28309.1 tRNA(Ile)-lysidine synthase [Sulfurimicrobium lacus]